MDVDIANDLGEILALQSEGLNKDPYDEAVLERVRLISEVYNNFVSQGFDGFRESFDQGYRAGQKDVRIALSSTGKSQPDAVNAGHIHDPEP